MLLSTQNTTATNLRAHLLILAVGCVLAACASPNSSRHLASGKQVHDGATRVPAAPRLRRESMARMASLDTFGNVVIESSIDAPCGYRDEHTAIVCMNVAGELNVADAALVQAHVQQGASIRVRDARAEELIKRARADVSDLQLSPAITVRASTDCRGACTGRLELVRAR